MRGSQGQRRDVAHVSRPHKSARNGTALQTTKVFRPDEHLRLPRSLDYNYLTGPRCDDMLGVIKLAKMLPQSKLQSLR